MIKISYKVPALSGRSDSSFTKVLENRAITQLFSVGFDICLFFFNNSSHFQPHGLVFNTYFLCYTLLRLNDKFLKHIRLKCPIRAFLFRITNKN